jgi:hypothetical protein
VTGVGEEDCHAYHRGVQQTQPLLPIQAFKHR